jgi:hypothetical protein
VAGSKSITNKIEKNLFTKLLNIPVLTELNRKNTECSQQTQSNTNYLPDECKQLKITAKDSMILISLLLHSSKKPYLSELQ